MTDIVARADGFRLGVDPTPDDVNEANWLIDRLTAEVERLRAAMGRLANAECFGDGRVLGMGFDVEAEHDKWANEAYARMLFARDTLTQEGE